MSPWTEITDSQQGQLLRFGSSGLRCSFPLGLGRGAPDVVNDVRFPETAHLCVRLLVSTSSVKSLLGSALWERHTLTCFSQAGVALCEVIRCASLCDSAL